MMDLEKKDSGAYNSTSLASFASCLHSKEKKNYSPRWVRIGRETVPSVFSAVSSLRPRAVLHTTGTVSSNTGLPAGE